MYVLHPFLGKLRPIPQKYLVSHQMRLRLRQHLCHKCTKTCRLLIWHFLFQYVWKVKLQSLKAALQHLFDKFKFKPRAFCTLRSNSSSNSPHIPCCVLFFSSHSENCYTHTKRNTCTYGHCPPILLHTVAGSRPDIRRASEKRASEQSGLGGGDRRCWWQWRWWNCATSELVHCEQQDGSHTTELNTSSTALRVAAELLLISGRFENSWIKLLIHPRREKVGSWWPERPEDVGSEDICYPGTELDVSRWVNRSISLEYRWGMSPDYCTLWL